MLLSDVIGKLDSNTMFVTVTFHLPGDKRKGSIYELVGEGNKIPEGVVGDRYVLHKKILQCDEFLECRRISVDVRRKIRDKWGYPSFMLREGVYRIPKVVKEEVHQYIKDMEAQFYLFRDALLLKYEQLIEDDRVALGSLFRKEDYPALDDFASRFGVEYRFFTIETEHSNVSEDQSIAEEVNLIKYHLRKGALAILETIHNCLGYSNTGRKMPMKESTWNRFLEFLRLFDVKNVVDDNELASLVGEIKEVLGEASLDDVRDEVFRSSVEDVVGRIVFGIKGLVEDSERCIIL